MNNPIRKPAAELRQRIAEMTPSDLGRLMRREGWPKWVNPYTGADKSLRHAAWLEGWQEADAQPHTPDWPAYREWLERPVPVWSPPWQFPDDAPAVSEPAGPHPDAEDEALIIAARSLDPKRFPVISSWH